MRNPLPPETRQQILELRQRFSISEAASRLGVPVGTVKTVCARSSVFKDNPVHAAFFKLPDAQYSTSRELAVPVLPPRLTVTGDDEVDAVLWLREVIRSGEQNLIDKALAAAELIKTPLIELERRYTQMLFDANPGNPFCTFSAFGFADLDRLIASSIETLALKIEADARIGIELVDLATELFCSETLKDTLKNSYLSWDSQDVAEQFGKYPEYLPHTLSDCLTELAYWHKLYKLRRASHKVELDQSCWVRENHIFDMMATIKARDKAEAIAVLEYLKLDLDRFARGSHILENLVRYG